MVGASPATARIAKRCSVTWSLHGGSRGHQDHSAQGQELRRVAEPLITLAKVDSVANRRLAFNRLLDKDAVGKLFTVIGPRYKARPGGYMRILKCGFRAGDAAPMAFVELVDRPAGPVVDADE